MTSAAPSYRPESGPAPGPGQVRVAASSVCGSDLWPYRGLNPVPHRSGRVLDQVLPLDDVAEGYAAMHERRAIRTLLRP